MSDDIHPPHDPKTARGRAAATQVPKDMGPNGYRVGLPRDPNSPYPPGSGRNPIQPVPLDDNDWAVRLARRYDHKIPGV